jgi:hypothetical protein
MLEFRCWSLDYQSSTRSGKLNNQHLLAQHFRVEERCGFVCHVPAGRVGRREETKRIPVQEVIRSRETGFLGLYSWGGGA